MQDKEYTHDLGHKVRIIQNCIDKYFRTSWEMDGAEPTRMQCATMHYLQAHQGEDVFQKDLEAQFSVSGATVTNILKIMEKEGLIRRVPMKNDARLKRLEMTEKGLALEKASKSQIIRLENGMKKDFTEEELARFVEYLDRLTENVAELLEENTK